MPLQKRQTNWARRLRWGAAGLVLLVSLLPFWLPWLLRPLAPSLGLSYQTYQHIGYPRLALIDVRWTNQTARFTAGRIETLVPTVWLWQVLSRLNMSPPPFVRVQDWRLDILPIEKAKAGSSVFESYQSMARAVDWLQRWMPVAELTNGAVGFAQAPLGVQAIHWNWGNLRADLLLPGAGGRAQVQARLKESPYEVRFEAADLQLHSTAWLSNGLSGVMVQTINIWRSNRVEVSAWFGPFGTWPQTAKLEVPEFRYPASKLRLREYADAVGSLSASWNQGRLKLDLVAKAEPTDGLLNLPPIALDLHARGDTNQVFIEQARLAAPWLSAELSRHLRVYLRGDPLREPAALKLVADLARQPWLPLQGKLAGEANFLPVPGSWPKGRLQLSGSDLGYAGVKVRSLELAGGLNWPQLQVSNAVAVFEKGATLMAGGELDFETESITDGWLKGNGQLVGHWLPHGWSYEELALTSDFHGPFRALVHNGRLTVARLKGPMSRPLTLAAEWKGRQARFDSMQVALSADGSALRMQGTVALRTNGFDTQLAALSLQTAGQSKLELKHPSRLWLERSSNAWRLGATPVDWTGRGGEIHLQGDLDWPRQGNVQVALSRISPRLAADFFLLPMPVGQIERLQARAAWTNGPMAYDLDLAVSDAASLAFNGAGDANGLVISNLALSSEGTPVASAHGAVPIAFAPANPTNWLAAVAAKPLQVEVAIEPEAFLWRELAARTGVDLREPRFTAALSGTWDAPQGDLVLSARQITTPLFKRAQVRPSVSTGAAYEVRELAPAIASPERSTAAASRRTPKAARSPQPPENGRAPSDAALALEDLRLSVHLDRARARLTEGQVLVQGQPMTLTGELPMGSVAWIGLWNKQMPDWQKGNAHLRIDHAELAELADFFPKYLSPQGELNVAVDFDPVARLHGSVQVDDARTRPLGSVGPVRDIQLRTRLENQWLRIERATANVGGGSVELTGVLKVDSANWRRGELPPFTMALYGTNVAFSRRTDSILRGDCNLGVLHTNGAPPQVSGVVRLHDSFFLADLNGLVAGHVATPSQRPPYFSVEEPVLADWRLAVQVEGERFLKVQSPVFNGEISAALRLQGTLKDPIALGDLRVNSGTVRFPFASFEVQQGLVSLGLEDPFQPRLLVNGGTRQYGYDLRMDLSGPVDKPNLQFTSTPPLGSEEVLMMVSSGQLPRAESNLTTQQRAETVALFLGRDMLDQLGLSDTSQQRLTIRSGQYLTEQGRPTYDVEYRFLPRWVVTGEYDRFGDYNAGFKWRIYSK